MSKTPRIAVIQKPARLSREIDALRAKGDAIALVPTMGALHAGHLALVRQARRRARRVIVSIFVNPTQFAPHEDLASYPRAMASDVAALTSLGVDVVWAPSAEIMYPRGFSTRIVPEGPAKVGLEDAFRPHFFSGVATVVAKLFLQCRPDIAVFGEKDYQQLKVVTAMARDLDIPVRVIGVPTVREKDGLAMSSRNAYLVRREREIAPALHRALRVCADDITQGRSVASALSRARKSVETAGFLLDYLDARNAETLLPLDAEQNEPIRLLVAARLGKTRLIDNIPVRAPSPRRRAISR